MKLDRLKEFINSLKDDRLIHDESVRTNVYWFFDEQWFDERTNVVRDDLKILNLSKALNTEDSFKIQGSPICYFPVKQLGSVVEIEFKRAPRKPKRIKINKEIEVCLTHSGHAYNANHDHLTGLYNKAAFEREIESLLCKKTNHETVDKTDSVAFSIPGTLVHIALDIDHFKQINDTHGHMYGDFVLKVFAKRLTKYLDGVRKKYQDVFFARPGGEEFSVLITGNIQKNDIREICSSLRGTIIEDVIPTQEEWEKVKRESGVGEIELPAVSERRVTVSIGVTTATLSTGHTDVNEVSKKVINEADISLYRAKSDGRDCIRIFDELIVRHGKVLEHHKGTNIIVIDVGRNVGVKKNQEFVVYHPDFTGSKEYIYSDGRTEKILGKYPRVPLARITVFDVQNEISFCILSVQEKHVDIPSGAWLELVPTGSITHLMADELLSGRVDLTVFSNISEFKKLIERVVDEGSQPYVAIFKIRSVESLEEERGSAFVNKVLSSLYKEIEKKFGDRASITQIGGVDIGLVIRVDETHAPNTEVKEILSVVDEKFKHSAKVAVGVYDVYKKRELTGDKSDIDSRDALSLAQYAAIDAINSGDVMTEYDAVVADNIVQHSREVGDYAKAVVDYSKLIELGVRYSSLENKIGLVYLERSERDYDKAIEHFDSAIALENTYYCQANKALALYEKTEFPNSLECFEIALSQLGDKGIDGFPEIYIPTFAIVSYICWIEDSSRLERSLVELRIKRALACEGSEWFGVTRTELEDISKKINEGTEN